MQVGGGTEAAHVTVARVDDHQQLFCLDQHVKCGYTLKVGPETFSSTVLADAAYYKLLQ